jgi:hypothetical protein
MKSASAFLLIFFLVNVILAQEKNLSGYYCNPRFGYRLNYPNKLLTTQPEAQNGDGRCFKDSKNNVILTVWGARNEAPEGDSTYSLNYLFAMEFKDGLYGLRRIGKLRTVNSERHFMSYQVLKAITYSIKKPFC